MLLTALLLAMVAVVTAPVVVRQLSFAMRLLVLGYFAFGVLAAYVLAPTTSALTGLDRAPDTYYLSLSKLEIVSTMAAIALFVYIGGAIPHLLGLFPRRPGVESGRVVVHLPPALLVVCVVGLAGDLVGTGFHTVLHAPFYLAQTGPTFLLNIGTFLLPVCVIIAANIATSRQASGVARLSAAVYLVLCELYFLGEATRAFAVFAVLVYAGAWLNGEWSKRGSMIRGVLTFVVSAVLLAVPLYLREQPEHGLIPALRYLLDDPVAVFFSGSNPLYNMLFGAPLTFYVWRQEPPIGMHALWTSLNPAPGGMTDWASVSPTLRLNIYEPYPALGELLNHGTFVTVGFLAALGFVIEMLSLVARQAPAHWQAGIQAAISGSAVIILIRSTQYNLRSEARLVYYLAFAVVGLVLLARLSAGRSGTGGAARPEAGRASAGRAGAGRAWAGRAGGRPTPSPAGPHGRRRAGKPATPAGTR